MLIQGLHFSAFDFTVIYAFMVIASESSLSDLTESDPAAKSSDPAINVTASDSAVKDTFVFETFMLHLWIHSSFTISVSFICQSVGGTYV